MREHFRCDQEVKEALNVVWSVTSLWFIEVAFYLCWVVLKTQLNTTRGPCSQKSS